MEAVLHLSTMLEVGKFGLSIKLARLELGFGVADCEYSLYDELG